MAAAPVELGCAVPEGGRPSPPANIVRDRWAAEGDADLLPSLLQEHLRHAQRRGIVQLRFYPRNKHAPAPLPVDDRRSALFSRSEWLREAPSGSGSFVTSRNISGDR